MVSVWGGTVGRCSPTAIDVVGAVGLGFMLGWGGPGLYGMGVSVPVMGPHLASVVDMMTFGDRMMRGKCGGREDGQNAGNEHNAHTPRGRDTRTMDHPVKVYVHMPSWPKLCRLHSSSCHAGVIAVRISSAGIRCCFGSATGLIAFSSKGSPTNF